MLLKFDYTVFGNVNDYTLTQPFGKSTFLTLQCQGKNRDCFVPLSFKPLAIGA